MANRRLTGRAAVEAWPDRMAAVRLDPCDTNLQRLCALLDAVDRWIVGRWDERGHDDRLATLQGLRRDAQEAHRLCGPTNRRRGAPAKS